jgi:hypothetical protein
MMLILASLDWVATLDKDPSRLDESPAPAANNNNVRNHPKFGDLFDTRVPESVEGKYLGTNLGLFL